MDLDEWGRGGLVLAVGIVCRFDERLMGSSSGGYV